MNIPNNLENRQKSFYLYNWVSLSYRLGCGISRCPRSSTSHRVRLSVKRVLCTTLSSSLLSLIFSSVIVIYIIFFPLILSYSLSLSHTLPLSSFFLPLSLSLLLWVFLSMYMRLKGLTWKNICCDLTWHIIFPSFINYNHAHLPHNVSGSAAAHMLFLKPFYLSFF